MASGYRGRGDSKRYYDWIDKAANDLKDAKILKDNSGSNMNTAFHCQQCMEKVLKGYILFKDRAHIDGHNLTFLCRKAMQLNPAMSEFLDESAVLNNYYIQTRYPTDIEMEITDEEIEKIYKMAHDVFSVLVNEIFGEDVDDALIQNKG